MDSNSDKSALIVSPSCYDFTLMLGNAATLRDNFFPQFNNHNGFPVSSSD